MSDKIRAAAEKNTRDSFALTAYSDGVKDERERIVNLLETSLHYVIGDGICDEFDVVTVDEITALIKGETE